MSSEQKPKITGSYIGIQMDTDPLVMQDGEYSYCFCGAINHNNGNEPFIGNINSNEFMSFLPSGYMIVGSHKLEENDTVVLLVNLVADRGLGSY